VLRIRDEFFSGKRLLPETIRSSMKKGSFYFSSLLLCRIRDKGGKML
jgi:hypothetical protein